MILGFWLDLPVWLVFALLAAYVFGVCGVISLVTNLSWTRPWIGKLSIGIAPTYIGVLAVLLALLTGFVANDAWERQRAASRVVQAERAHALAAYDLSHAAAPDMSDLRKALVGYLDAVIDAEWPAMADTGRGAPQAGAALARLLETAADPRTGTEAGQAVQTSLLTAVLGLRSARGERLALVASEQDETKWLTLMVLAGLTMISIGLVHWERPLAQATTLILFAAAMVTTLGVIALHERPFDGPLALKPEPLRLARSVVVAGTR
ncbi:hypothetical protein VQ02_15670 [Methylobacterium variabile]|jgi:hypothetical protein|uniref:DUF4239 domain-containing protein n=1 Tax=Methylobacterium variabile TaxID=298794 RepID=A0A0J6SRM0_9HYPH|nr:DUF4239 domain-containing protein [Methylobacterium variabile]KMO36232.1 hypothetical protein VQ02_15670 [Methylobacterium variabile]